LASTREDDGRWRVSVKDVLDGSVATVSAKFVFIGAGGGALPLLQKSKIPEGKGYGGFPVSGIWLRCDVDTVSHRHHAKVYGKASDGSPPLTVPAPRHAHRRRQALAAVRSLCGLLDPFPQAWCTCGPVHVADLR
jgi:L-2-hydroxyglutarate oxidase LhgO